MILGPFAWVDCFVFFVFLVLHLVLTVGIWRSLWHFLGGLPFLGRDHTLLPFNLWDIRADLLEATEVPTVLLRQVRFALRLSREPENAFDRHATVFESLVVRCARYANANLPPDVLQAFFHRNVVYPVLRFRMFRHLYIKWPVKLEEYVDATLTPPVEGIWIRDDAASDPDIVLYYIHGESAL